MRAFRLLVCGAVLTGCGGESTSPDGLLGSLPSSFHLVADAQSGDTISCYLAYTYEIRSETRRTADVVEYQGVYGGEAFRAHLQSDGSGEAFWADVYGEFKASLLPGDSLELRYIGPTSPGSRFWDQQVLFAGKVGGPELASGQWSCEPLDVRSDTTGIAAGTWQLRKDPPGS